MNPNPAAGQRSLRREMAGLLARRFAIHLQAEIDKPDEVLYEVFKEWPVRQMMRNLLEEVQDQFEIAESEILDPENIFIAWVERNGKFQYDDSAFISYNLAFVHRLIDLREGSAHSQESMFAAMRKGFGSFDYEKRGFSVSFFLDSESNMREVLRETVKRNFPDQASEADAIVLAQSRIFQTGMFEYFEGLLKTTLADNVRLLHNILPDPVASELRENGFVEPVGFEDAAVLFTDFERFSQHTEHLAPAEVLRRLDLYFTEFDRVCARHGLEKIKTIGDSYMAVAGVPDPIEDPVSAACDAALEILEASNRISETFGAEGWNIRIGVHVGPLMAGVIGKQKFSYDVWGATVNFASRMESSGEPGKINVSAEIHARARGGYSWEARGPQPVKRLGMAEMFFLLGKKAD